MIRSREFQVMLLFLAVMLYAWFPVWTVWHAINSNDFKHIYLGMKALLDGNSPYPIQSLHHQAALQGYRQISLNPYVYLPFTGHAMAFLAPFQLHQAVNIWFTLNHVFVAGSVFVISRLFPRWRIGSAALLLASLAFSVPLYRTLTAGQLNLALLFLICLAWHQAHKGRYGWCGAIMAFAALFKLMPGIYGLYFILRRRWRATAVMIVSGIVLLLISIVLAGPEIYLEFFPVLQQMGYGKSTWPHVFSFWDDPSNQSLNSFFTHVLASNNHTAPWLQAGQGWANLCTIIVTGALLITYIATTWQTCSRSESPVFSFEDEAAWCATLILGLLIPSLMWDHYLVMLILPVAWLIRAGINLKRYASIAATVICYGITCVPWNFGMEPFQQGPGVLLMSLKLWPTLVLFGLSLCFMYWSGKDVPSGQGKWAEGIEPEHVEPENTR